MVTLGFLMGTLLLAPAATPGAIPGASVQPPPALIAVQTGPGNDAYTLVCRGACRHRLVEDGDGWQVTVELPGVVNDVPAESLPEPSGLVDALTLGGGAESTRLIFALNRPAGASAELRADGLEVRLLARAQASFPAESAERTLGTEDLLAIDVFEVPQLDRKVRISSTGVISLPLVGDVHAAGLTPRQLEATIQERLADGYVKDPHVSVFVEEHGSKKVSVLGAVGKPGVYEMLGPRRLLQVLAQAGGLTDDAGAELYVIRTAEDGSARQEVIGVESLMTNSDPGLNVEIVPGDVVTVPMDRMTFVYVDGAVNDPGRIEQPSSRPITLLQAMAKAGGATTRANLKKVQILRKLEGGGQTVFVMDVGRIRKGSDPDPELEDGDVVVVPESFF